MKASLLGHTEVANRLISSGAVLDLQSTDGHTAMDLAKRKRTSEDQFMSHMNETCHT